MDRFLSHNDELGRLIETGATELYKRLKSIDVDKLAMPYHCLVYFKTSHSKRLFFSIETSAHLLYRAIRMTGKMPEKITIMDYGAGVGTLYLLAKLIGCRQVIYNDHLEDWKHSAELLADAIGVTIDVYTVGDIDDCLDQLDKLKIRCDLITSRNVIEHIYKLEDFYSAVYKRQPAAIIFSSTTANKSNPASQIKHILWHRKWEKVYRGKRVVLIEREAPEISAEKVKTLANATRGLGGNDLKTAIDSYKSTGRLPDPSVHNSNTCDPSNGVWAEHLLNTKEYRKLIGDQRYDITFAPGFWDTHYNKGYMNAASKIFNRIISKAGGLAMKVAPFIYVIASPRKNN